MPAALSPRERARLVALAPSLVAQLEQVAQAEAAARAALQLAAGIHEARELQLVRLHGRALDVLRADQGGGA